MLYQLSYASLTSELQPCFLRVNRRSCLSQREQAALLAPAGVLLFAQSPL